jgi:hypothetical protein
VETSEGIMSDEFDGLDATEWLTLSRSPNRKKFRTP